VKTAAIVLALVVSVAAPAAAQRRPATDRYDDVFRKYTKRYFGVGYDWRIFKAQGMAESDLTPTARSRVGARGIMQLMPSTYQQIRSNVPMMRSIDDPEWNIAAGILHDRDLWERWKEHQSIDDRRDFMFASYNAGEGPILRAQRVARDRRLDEKRWPSIETVATEVPRWRYQETLGYVRRIRLNLGALDDKGRVQP
jgi:membrane-bound lytic murein transglycosylase F